MGLLTTKIKSILDYYIDFNFEQVQRWPADVRADG